MILVVEKVVDPEVLGGMGDECHSQIQREDYDKPEDVQPGLGIGPRDDDFEDGEDGVQRVLGDVLPCRLAVHKRWFEEYGPKHDCYVFSLEVSFQGMSVPYLSRGMGKQ